ncbi:MAG: hypothetical protein GF364_21480 [Candidatus Lokiarchaeota archaeon]|nr:hypothetical protein [Candidatus Lokiarchaeota archaeon]
MRMGKPNTKRDKKAQKTRKTKTSVEEDEIRKRIEQEVRKELEEKIRREMEKKLGDQDKSGVAQQETETEKDQKDQKDLEESAGIEYEIEIPTDSRAIWAIQRFFIFSLIVTFFKVYVSIISDLFSVRAIAIDAAIDLIVSGLGIYLIQWQRKIFEKLKNGTQDIEVNQTGAITIATIQGLILFIGGLVVFFQGLGTLFEILAYAQYLTPSNEGGYSLLPALILAGIMCTKYTMHLIEKQDAEATGNIAIESIATNLLVDTIVALSTWIILILTSFWYWPFIALDPVIGIIIGIWMIASGVKYLRPFLKMLYEYLGTYGFEEEGQQKDAEEEYYIDDEDAVIPAQESNDEIKDSKTV